MVYEIYTAPSAEGQFSKLEASLKIAVSDRIRPLADNPRPVGVKKVKGAVRTYRIREAGYRIVYEIDDAEKRVIILKIKPRDQVYKDK